MDVEQAILQFTKGKYDELHAEVEKARSWSRAWKASAKQHRRMAWCALSVMKEAQEEAERAEAEVARLREALKNALAPHDYRDKCVYCRRAGEALSEDGHADWCPFAALSTPADDWLEQHDAEVRERCGMIADGWCRCSEPYPSMGLIDPGCDAHDIAGDIRESTE